MGELLLLGSLLAAVALAVVWPLLDRPAPAPQPAEPELEALQVRHRLALEALRDVEADHRAGSLDADAYAREREEAEQHAIETRRALDAGAASSSDEAPRPVASQRGLQLGVAIGVGLVLLLALGYVLPAPFRIAERDARLERIRVLTDAVSANPNDTAALAELSDQYLAGGSPDDVTAALASLILLRNAEPESRDGNQRLVTLLIRAGLWDQAATATDAYARVVGERDADIPFFRGLIARGKGDAAEARKQFEEFLQLAPNDDRAQMVQGLMAGLMSSPSPSP